MTFLSTKIIKKPLYQTKLRNTESNINWPNAFLWGAHKNMSDEKSVGLHL